MKKTMNVQLNYFGAVSYYYENEQSLTNSLSRELEFFLGFEDDKEESNCDSENKYVPNFVNFFGVFANISENTTVIDNFNMDKEFVFGFNPKAKSAT